jgi:hypothetical protein
MSTRAIAVFVMALVGCAVTPAHLPLDTAGDDGRGSAGSSRASVAPSGDDAGTSSLAFTVSGAMSDGYGRALGSATLCVLGSPGSCTTADASGGYSLTGVPATGSGVVGTAAGGVTTLWPLTLGGDAANDGKILTDVTIHTYAAEAHTSFGGGTGAIAFVVLDGAGNGYPGVEVVPVSGGDVGYFANLGSFLDGALTSTSATGAGYVFGLEAGTATLSISGASLATCGPASGAAWVASAPQSVLAPVQAGAVTVVRIVCQ